MNAQDYISLASLLLNLFFSVKALGLTKKNVEKALYNNRTLIGKTLSDIAEHMTHTDSLPDAASVVESDVAKTVEGIAHSQAGGN